MAYTDPATFAGGAALEAAELNVLGDDIRYLYGVAAGTTFSGVSLARGSAQSISNATDTPITWTAETFDFGAYWSSGTGITIPAGAIPAGFTSCIFLVAARMMYASNATGVRRVVIYKNGSEITRRTAPAINGDATDVDIWRGIELVAGDVITVNAYQSSGGSLNVSPAAVELFRFAPAT